MALQELNVGTVTIFYLRSNLKMHCRIPQKFYGTFVASSLRSHQCASGLQEPAVPVLRDEQWGYGASGLS